MQQLQLTSYVDVYCHDIWWKPNEASFHANEGDKLLRPWNVPNQAICKHFTLSLVFLSLSNIVLSNVQTRFPKISLNTLTTSYETGWLVLKSHIKSLLTYNSIMLISAPRVLKPRQMSFGTETRHFQPFPLSMVQIPTMTRYLAYTLS